jgi:hypothetical protein
MRQFLAAKGQFSLLAECLFEWKPRQHQLSAFSAQPNMPPNDSQANVKLEESSLQCGCRTQGKYVEDWKFFDLK